MLHGTKCQCQRCIMKRDDPQVWGQIVTREGETLVLTHIEKDACGYWRVYYRKLEQSEPQDYVYLDTWNGWARNDG